MRSPNTLCVLIALCVLQGIWRVNAQGHELNSNLLMRTGGIITRPETSKEVAILNLNGAIHRDILKSEAEAIGRILRCRCCILSRVSNEPFMVTREVMNSSTNFAVLVTLCESQHLPPLVIVPEGRYCIVNTTALGISPQRLSRELMRAICGIMGVSYSSNPQSAWQPLRDVNELDKISGSGITQDTTMQLLYQAPRFGIVPGRRTTYRRACEEGWAPAPTNQFQKAIWEQVKAKK